MPSKLLLPPRAPRLPLPLQRRSSDECTPLPHHPRNVPVVTRLRAEGPDHAARLSMSLSNTVLPPVDLGPQTGQNQESSC